MRKKEYIEKIKEYYEEFNNGTYISNQLIYEIKNRYFNIYNYFKKRILFQNISVITFLKDYRNIENMQISANNIFYESEIKKTKKILNDINGIKLDIEQKRAVLSNDKYTLIVAGAGSGKSLTIVGKVKYLIKYKKILAKEILCISFTKASAESLKNKINTCVGEDIDVFTFHKLGLKILEQGEIKYNISEPDTLEYIVNEYLNYIILDEVYYMNLVLEYLEIPHRNLKYVFIKYQKSKEFILLKNLLIKFINLFKANCYKRKMFELFFLENNKILNRKLRNKMKLFLELSLHIYDLYEEELNSLYEIDFNDMIIKATDFLDNNCVFDYKYILIDEFQDTSKAKLLLIKKLIKKTNAKLIAVGDDWQSIYRFTGCNLNIFLDFAKYFENAKILKLENTYRNSLELITTSSNFIMKNKNQINKGLKSSKNLEFPIKIVYTDDYKKDFKKLLRQINSNVLIIGRNNNDIYKVIDNSFKLVEEYLISDEFKNKNITYLTVHKSKGLEEENVIIINLEDDLLGFPNKLEDNNELKYVLQKKEDFLYAEERRLFYVALTRTKSNVYLLVNKKNKSCFVKELLYEDNVKEMKI